MWYTQILSVIYGSCYLFLKICFSWLEWLKSLNFEGPIVIWGGGLTQYPKILLNFIFSWYLQYWSKKIHMLCFNGRIVWILEDFFVGDRHIVVHPNFVIFNISYIYKAWKFHLPSLSSLKVLILEDPFEGNPHRSTSKFYLSFMLTVLKILSG